MEQNIVTIDENVTLVKGKGKSMPSEIIAAIIGGVAVVIAAIVNNAHRTKSKTNSCVRFIAASEDFRNIIPRVNKICAYTINSYEIFNKINTILEQNQKIVIRNLTLLVRKKPDETPEDITVLDKNISLWKNLKEKGRIKNLTIIAYDHDPDHYYTLFGNKAMFCGQVLFDKSKPTGTTVNYLPLVFENTDKIGVQVIKNYQNHFDNVVSKYKGVATLYPSS